MITTSLLFILVNLIQLSLCSQEIQTYQRESCDKQLTDQFSNKKIQFIENEKSITIQSQDSILLSVDIQNCNFERQIIFQNIMNLTLQEMKISQITYLERQILLYNITYLDIQETKMTNIKITLPLIIIEKVDNVFLKNFEINKKLILDYPIIQLNLNIKLLKIKNSFVSLEGQSSEISQFLIESSHATFLLFNKPLIGFLSLQKSKFNIGSRCLEIIKINIQQGEIDFKGFQYNEENQNSNLFGDSYLLVQDLRLEQYEDGHEEKNQLKISNYEHIEILNINLNSMIEFYFSYIQNLHLRGLIMIYNDIFKKYDDSRINIDNCQNILIENVQFLNNLNDYRSFIGFNVNSSTSVEFSQFNISNIYMNNSLFRILMCDKVIFKKINIFQFKFNDIGLFQIIECIYVTFQNMEVKNKFQLKEQSINKKPVQKYDNNLNDPSTNKNDLYLEDPKYSLINYTFNQNSIPQIITINFQNINADFDGYESRFLYSQTSSCELKPQINISNCNFKNLGSSQNGGCIRAKFCFELTKEQTQFNVITINQTQFDKCWSHSYGGAIFTNGILQLQDVIFRECQSYIGSDIVVYNSNFLKQQNITYINNISKQYKDNNVFIFWSKPEIDKVYLIQEPTFYNKIQKEVDIGKDGYFHLTPGMFYMLILKVVAVKFQNKGEVQQFYNTWDYNFLHNLYDHVDFEQTNLSKYFFNIDYVNQINKFSYLIFKFDSDQQIEDNQIYFKSDFISDNKINLKFKITECLNGMEKVLITPFIDKYECQQCLYMYASYNNIRCQRCDLQYFDYCYSNISSVKQGYHRTEFTINKYKIYQCKYYQIPCMGGEGFGNQLCSEGHIGVECKCCDLTGMFWNERYGNNGQYQCIKCSQLNNNKSLIVILFIFFIIIIPSLINSNLNKIELLIKQKYLSKMNLMYFGSTFKNLGQSSVYFKIFSFYAQMLQYMKQQLTLSVTQTLLGYSTQLQNPMAGGVTLDCALTEVFSGEQNIEKIKLYIIILFPFSIFPIIMLIQLIMLKKKMINKKLFKYSAMLSIIYVTFIISYNSILSIILDAFFCHKFENGESKSQLNLNIDCDEMQQKWAYITIPVFFGYCIGIPLFILTILILYRKKLSIIPIMFKYGFLYREYKQKLYFWEIIRFFVRVSQILVSKILLFDFVFQNYTNMIILILYMISLLKYKPFQRNYFNILEYISILINIVNFISLITFSIRSQQNTSDILDQNTEIIIIFSCYLSITYLFFLLFMIIYSQIEECLSKYCQFCFCRRRRRIDLVRATQRVKQFRQIINRVIDQNKNQKVEFLEFRLFQEEIERNKQFQIELQEQNLNQIQNDDEEQQTQGKNELQFESQIILVKDNQENQNN